jgi:hypothetical protein
VTKVTPQVPIVEHELLTLPEHMSSSPVSSEVRVTRSLVLCVMFYSSLSFFFWQLCFLSCDLQIPIIPLVSSNSSYLLKIVLLFPCLEGLDMTEELLSTLNVADH